MKRLGWITVFVCMSGLGLAAEAAETLIVPPYPGAAPWKKINDQHNDRMTWIEWIPADQTENDVKDVITQQSVHGVKRPSPSVFMILWFQNLKTACASVRINGPMERVENDISVAYGQAYCTDQKGISKDVDIFLKVIEGKEGLYIMQREFRRPTERNPVPGVRTFSGDGAQAASKAAMEAQVAANDYLGQIRLCPSAEPCAVPASWPVDGKTPQSEIREKLGQPFTENQNPDGRHIDFYKGPDGLVRTYLYGKDNVLIELSVHTMPKQ